MRETGNSKQKMYAHKTSNRKSTQQQFLTLLPVQKRSKFVLSANERYFPLHFTFLYNKLHVCIHYFIFFFFEKINPSHLPSPHAQFTFRRSLPIQKMLFSTFTIDILHLHFFKWKTWCWASKKHANSGSM